MEPPTIELQKKRVTVEILEERLAPSHLAHEVLLPRAAVHGAQGVQVAQQTAPDIHTRAIMTFAFVDTNPFGRGPGYIGETEKE